MTVNDAASSIYIEGEYLVRLIGLYDNDAESYVNDATVSAQLYESDRTTTIGSSVSMSYQASSKGNYQGTIPSATTSGLTVDTTYFIKITITGTATDARWIKLTAKYRGAL